MKVVIHRVVYWLIACGIVAFLYARRSEVFQFLGPDSFALVPALLITLYFRQLCSISRLFVTVRATDASVRYLDFLVLFSHCRLANAIIPQSGTVVGSVHLKNRFRVSVPSYLAALSVSSIMGGLVASVLAVVILAIDNRGSGTDGMETVLSLVIGGYSVALLCLVLLAGRMWRHRNGYAANPYRRLLVHFRVAVAKVLHCPGVVFLTIATSVVSHVFAIAAVLLCLGTTEVSLSVGQAASLIALLTASTAITLLPGNLGLVETVWGFAFRALGLSTGTGVAFALTYRALNLCALLALGLSARGFRAWRGDRASENLV